MIVGIFDIYFRNNNEVFGFVRTNASHPQPLQRFDINISDLKGHHYWLLNTKKFIDGDVKAKRVNEATYKGQISDYSWPCKNYFEFDSPYDLNIQ